MLIKTLIERSVRSRSKVVIDRISPYIRHASKIIDIGSGTGDIALLLRNQGKDITPVDIRDFHGIRLIDTIIYDGHQLPFPDQSFDIALLLMVMHHTPDPTIVFSEAVRVAKELVVIETSYKNTLEKIITVIGDTLANLRLTASWSSYKSDREWREFFHRNGLKVVKSHQYPDHLFGLPFLHLTYYLKKS